MNKVKFKDSLADREFVRATVKQFLSISRTERGALVLMLATKCMEYENALQSPGNPDADLVVEQFKGAYATSKLFLRTLSFYKVGGLHN